MDRSRDEAAGPGPGHPSGNREAAATFPDARMLDELEDLVRVPRAMQGPVGAQPSTGAIEGMLRIVRERLKADVVFVRAWDGGEDSYRWIDGDHPEYLRAFEQSLRRHHATSPQPDRSIFVEHAEVGDFISVPVFLPDGFPYGSLCAISFTEPSATAAENVDFVEMVARLVGEHVESGQLRERQLSCARKGLESVIDRGGMRMVFQPIFDLRRDQCVGFEALARINTKPPKAPSAWFDAASSLGMAHEVEMIAVRSALANAPALPPHMFLSVNVSPDVCQSAVFMAAFDGLDPSAIVIEITEHARIDNYDALETALTALRRRGARVAVDDCGAGFANLLHLLRLQPDIIKLDLAITRGIDCDPTRRALAGSLVGFAIQTGATIVAEGVETKGELDTLRALGVAWGQGYLLGRPGPLESYLE